MKTNQKNMFQLGWPIDIPQECPSCGSILHPKINLSFGYGKVGRLCQWLSWWGTLGWGLLLIVFGAFTAASRWGGFVIGIGIAIPWALFSVLAVISPSSRRVRCYPCKYSRDYRAKPAVIKNEAEQGASLDG